jgi:hypothetical protein
MKLARSVREPEAERMTPAELERRRHEFGQARRAEAASEFEQRRQEQIARAQAFDAGQAPAAPPPATYIVGSQRRAPIRAWGSSTGHVSAQQMQEDLARLGRELGWRD